jgi:hypothetical protein
MDVDDCARVIGDGLAAGMEEISVAVGREMALLSRSEPIRSARSERSSS